MLSGQESINKIRFLIKPEQAGEVEYKVQVNALPEEINISNNKQVLPIQVLKNQYRIAIITGAPNFNTRIIKDILNNNEKFISDHFYLTNSGYSTSLKQFWDTRYDLILFDNLTYAFLDVSFDCLMLLSSKDLSFQASLLYQQ